MLAIQQQKKRTGSQRESRGMLPLQTDPTTNQAERTCFMALPAATSSFGMMGTWTLGSQSHWCAGFNTKAKMDRYSDTDTIMRQEWVCLLNAANWWFKWSKDLLNIWSSSEPLRFFQRESGFMLQQVTITTPGITRCLSTDILVSRATLAKAMRLKPPAR